MILSLKDLKEDVGCEVLEGYSGLPNEDGVLARFEIELPDFG